MKVNYYGKLALGNLQKNSRFYLPFVLTQAGLLGCFYIILTLAMDDRLKEVKGGSYLPTFMLLGLVVMTILSTILVMYMNGFLMRQRKHEFGLYNILGMEKRHVCRILWMESVFSNGAAILLGLAMGIVFYKFCSLLICKLLNVKSVLGFYYIRPINIIPTLLFFAGLDLLLYFGNSISIRRMKPVELLQSRKAGEREPKVNWFFFIPGIICMGWGYYMSLTSKNAMIAINNFFGAVILVIIGTYFLFVAGSVAVLRMLKANKKYYYNKKHMVGLSGLLYRMRQNAVGLASITILACGVLVMISTTISLYAGMEDSLRRLYPEQIYVDAWYETEEGRHELSQDELLSLIEDKAKDYGATLGSYHTETLIEVAYRLEGNRLITDQTEYTNNIAEIVYITASEYEKMTGNHVDLDPHEILLCPYNPKEPFPADTLIVAEEEFQIVDTLDTFPVASSYSSLVSCYGVVLADEETIQRIYEDQKAAYTSCSEFRSRLAVSLEGKNLTYEEGNELSQAIWKSIGEYCEKQPGFTGARGSSWDAYWDAAENMYGMYGSLLFLGLILGFVFLFATALIIYYKQISEGYEDRSRFQIMSKIGLSQKEAKQTISGQILMVFFLPLIIAGIHLIVAFPMLKQLVALLQLGDSALFVKCTLLAFAGFAIIYTVIYEMTAKVYYKIVS